ncbi:MAG: hypothetical protein GY913_33745 [Proteobacteria bacterium]|nr:hypothetical protein [Pseudomonadota bacterium]MCP4921892.1 hypothetical protein [Pseudomonadota bacterium]
MILLLAACAYEAQIVKISGVITQGPDSEEGASEVTVTSLGPTYEEAGTGITDGRGWVEVDAVGGSPVFLTLEGEGYLPTGFAGSVGLEDLELGDGDVWMRTTDAQDTIAAEFEGCDDGTGTSLVEGLMRHNLAGYEVDDGGDWPIAHEGFVWVTDEDGTVWEACYLDDDGDFDAEAELTGQTGRFAVYGTFSGPVVLTAGYELAGEPYWATEYYIHVPEGGVSPLYPVYVSLPE